MTLALFLVLLACCDAGIVVAGFFWLKVSTAIRLAVGIAAWLTYVGMFGYYGLAAYVAGRLPGIILLFAPIVIFIVFGVARSRTGRDVAVALPFGFLIGAQVFRLGVELILHQLSAEGVVPRMLTFEGSNLDVWIGLSAPIVAWIASQRRIGPAVAMIWTIVGLLSLANVMVRSVLSAPGPLKLIATEVPNLVVSTFPYIFIPGFLAPLGIVLHVLTLRSLRAERARGVSGGVGSAA